MLTYCCIMFYKLWFSRSNDEMGFLCSVEDMFNPTVFHRIFCAENVDLGH